METQYSELLAAFERLSAANAMTGIQAAKDFSKNVIICISELDNRLAAIEELVHGDK